MSDDTAITPDEYYCNNRRPNRTYISTGFDSTIDYSERGQPRRLRILHKVFDDEEQYGFAQIKDEVVLRVSPGGREEIKVVFFEDNRKLKSIAIQKFSRKNGKPYNMDAFLRWLHWW